MWSKPEVCFMYDKGKVVMGHITYNLDWKKDWLEGGNPELCSITFKEGQRPDNALDVAKNKDVKAAIDKCENDFAYATGVDYEEWNRMSNKEQMDLRKKIKEKKVRGLRAKAGIIDDAPVGINITMDIDKVKEEIEELKKKLGELETKKEDNYCHKGWNVKYDDGSYGKLYIMDKMDC